MDRKTATLLIGELTSLSAYLERLFHVIFKLKQTLAQDKNCRDLIYIAAKTMAKAVSHLSIDGQAIQLEVPQDDLEKQERFLLRGLEWIKIGLSLGPIPLPIKDLCIHLLNELYQLAYQLHAYIDPYNEMRIQLPRVGVLSCSTPKEDDSIQIPCFYLTSSNFDHAATSANDFISLGHERRQRYDRLLRQGHHYIYCKDYKAALESFLAAYKIKATAQSLNLVAWGHSLVGNLAEAKKYCLKAIKQDPDFGDPYNDMGSYLLLEGHLKECLEWFNLAKKAKYYIHREFPYINAGKAYLMQKKHGEALKEFSMAIKFVPYQRELKKMVERLKIKIAKQEGPIPPDPPLS